MHTREDPATRALSEQRRHTVDASVHGVQVIMDAGPLILGVQEARADGAGRTGKAMPERARRDRQSFTM